MRRFGRGNGLRFFAPPALIVTIGLAAVIAVLQATGVLSAWWAVAASAVYLPLLAYVVLVLAVAIGPGGGTGWRDKLWTAAVLPSMHLSWGTGFLIGVLRGAHDTVDTSRLGDRNTPLP